MKTAKKRLILNALMREDQTLQDLKRELVRDLTGEIKRKLTQEFKLPDIRDKLDRQVDEWNDFKKELAYFVTRKGYL